MAKSATFFHDLPQIEKTIQRLQEVIADLNCTKMNLSTVKGYLGELLVAQKLTDEGATIRMVGNHSGYDLEIPDFGVRIDVKFSTIKSEVKGCPDYWGWALKHASKLKDITCTHIVLVAVDRQFQPVKFYVVRASMLDRFPASAIRQFKNVVHGCVLLVKPADLKTIAPPELKAYFDINKTFLSDQTISQVSTKGSLMNALKKV